MAESIINVTEGSGKKIHTISYTVGANTVEDEVIVAGPQPWATYTVQAPAVSGATANDHLLCLNAGASLKVRVHRIKIAQVTNATAAAYRQFQIFRTTTAAPTGGTAVTAALFDTADSAAGAAGRTLPTAKGTETTIVLIGELVASQALLTTATQSGSVWQWQSSWTGKPIIIPTGTTNGLVIKNVSATAGVAYDVEMEFTETAF